MQSDNLPDPEGSRSPLFEPRAAGAAELIVASSPVERVNLFEVVASQIEDAVLSGDLQDGTRLPSEGVLAKQFGVSRPIIREALARLRDRGLVKTVTGSGTFVRQPDVDHLAEALLRQLREARTDGESIRDLYEARIAIETMTAQLAAVRATERDHEAIVRHLETMRSAQGDRDRWTDADFKFHLAISTASHNPFLSTLLAPLGRVIQRSIFETQSARAVPTAIRMHDEIWDAIRRKDAIAAGDAMRRHLLDAQQYFSQRASS
jgi:GntR family transcriptional regulator, transcriptional repressor for pyruvate dehydrogenase complex